MSTITLPDICGYLDNPTHGSKRRFIEWFEKYMYSYSQTMSGEEAYALRCAVLHNGELATTQYKLGSPKSGIVLDKFVLKADGTHRIRSTGETIDGVNMPGYELINVPMFCEDLIAAVEVWQQHAGKTLGEYDDVFRIAKGPIDLFGGMHRIE